MSDNYESVKVHGIIPGDTRLEIRQLPATEILRITHDGQWQRGGDHRPLEELMPFELIEIIRQLVEVMRTR